MFARPSSFFVPFFYLLSRHALTIAACLAIAALPLGAAASDNGEAALKPSERILQLRDEAGKLRTQAESNYRTAETACYKHFFVNSCIDGAKTKRLAVIHRARELEAEAYQLDLAERRKKTAEMERKAEGLGSGSRLTEASSPGADKDVAKPRPETEKSSRRVVRSNTTSDNSNARAKAAHRAEAAQRDRERYDARIRELEEKKARDADGR
ncbi:MAG: hypothetical protein FWF12_12445 [Betaproteobacteria bacterium]|nr:hypothetical protein [Betaproteobacteria bacterium]